MGKISPVSIKYIIYAKFNATGVVEKPDVIGAIFGQTEGLLGEDLELRELQKNGKIGRIEVELKTENSNTEGEIQIPTSLDKAETTIIAAAIETIERVGPCEAKVSIEKIEDVRSNKREYVIERAKKLLAEMTSPDSREIETEVATSLRTGKVIEFGEENLPAGPDMDNEEIIVVEGRADVMNLLAYGIKNVIAMNGASLPKTIGQLGETKKLILFVDGDRGGTLIAKDALANANIYAIARAPDGKEVEELTGKEILACLRAKMTASEFKREFLSEEDNSRRKYRESKDEDRLGERFERKRYGSRGRGRFREGDRYSVREESTPHLEEAEETKMSDDDKINFFREKLESIEGTKGALIYDSSLELIKKSSAGELQNAIRRSRRKIYAIVLDGLATSSMISVAEKAGCKYFIAKNFAVSEETKINLLSL